jgi:diguanylate cyclase (GGDEF)-like protein
MGNTVIRFVGLVALYLLGAWIALNIKVLPSSLSLIWPPQGIAFAALFLYGKRYWPFMLISMALVHLIWIDTLPKVPFFYLPFSIAANTIGVLLAVALAERVLGANKMQLRLATGGVMVAAALLAAFINALIGVGGLVLFHIIPLKVFWINVLLWSLGDIFGIIVFSPSAMLLVRAYNRRRLSEHALQFASLSERLIWVWCLILAGWALVHASLYSPSYALSLGFLPVALLAWSALRFEPVLTACATTSLCMGLIGMAGKGLAGFKPPQNVPETIILIIYLLLLAILPLLLAAATYEARVNAAEVLRRATTDRLTNLPNRAAFEEHANECLRETVRPLALIYLDLDHFKVVNDTVSHAVGDDVIRQLASVIVARLPSDTYVARLGGDEFALLMKGTSAAEASLLATIRAVLDAIAEFRFPTKTGVVALHASAGIAIAHNREHDFGSLLARADAACSLAKELGGNRLEISSAGSADVQEREQAMHWVFRLTDAMENARFFLYCQSITTVGRDEPYAPRHFEILLRMRSANGEDILPGRFIAAAERFQLSVRIDRHVLQQTIKWFEQNPAVLKTVGMVSINLSGASMADSDFLEFAQNAIRESTLGPHRICFEITETSAIRDLRHAQKMISTLKAMGVRFALDDFGAGFCSFGYLDQLDVDFLKIDGSFVLQLHASELARAVIRSIADIARTLGKKTVAECAETEEIRSSLFELGVDYAQGFVIDRPMLIDHYFGLSAPPSSTT